MATERQKFLYEQSCIDFDNLKNYIGKKVKVNFVRDGININSMGELKSVVPFQCIELRGLKIDFVSRNILLRSVNDLTGNLIYDRTYIIPSNAKVTSDLGRYKLAIMGAEQERVKQGVSLSSAVLHQDT